MNIENELLRNIFTLLRIDLQKIDADHTEVGTLINILDARLKKLEKWQSYIEGLKRMLQ